MREERGGKNVVTPDGRENEKDGERKETGTGGVRETVHPLCREILSMAATTMLFFFYDHDFPFSSPRCQRGFSSRRRRRGGGWRVEKRSEQKRVKLV